MFVSKTKCKELDIDPEKVESLVRRLSKAAEEIEALGLVVFGSAGLGTLRVRGGSGHDDLAVLDGSFCGDGEDVEEQ